ncbi:unnamed protein product, partial [marine sediment metagenome]
NVWPKVEGTALAKGSLQGQFVSLHLDIDKVAELKGEDAKLAAQIMKNSSGSVPELRVFKPDAQTGELKMTKQSVGALSQTQLEKFLKDGGVEEPKKAAKN